MNATDFLLKKYPHVVGLALDEEGLGEILEEYHREKIAEGDCCSQAGIFEQQRILGIIEELAEKSGLRIGEDGKPKPWHLLQKEELIEKIKE